jgi:hypothetical protein
MSTYDAALDRDATTNCKPAAYHISRVVLPKYPAMPPGFIVNSGRWPFVDESGRDAPCENSLGGSLGLPMLEMLLSPLLDVVSTSYRESTVDAGGLGLGSFSGRDRPSMGSTISKNPSITKKSPETIFGFGPHQLRYDYTPMSRSPAFAR